MRTMIVCALIVASGPVLADRHHSIYRSGDVDKFGTYSERYYAKRWAKMCKGSARYAAMREAFEMGKPQPCQ